MSGKSLKILIAIFVLFFSFNVEAVSPAQPILPSDNIQDPGALSTPWGGCTPSDANCYVTTSGSSDFSENVDALEYSALTGLSLAEGYIIPTSTSVDAWNALVTDSSNFVRQGGNALGATLTIGTNDANNLSFRTDSTERLTITAGGNVGINNSNPGYTFDVNGDINASGYVYGGNGSWNIDPSGNFSGTAAYANSAGYASYVNAGSDSNFNGFNLAGVGILSASSLSLNSTGATIGIADQSGYDATGGTLTITAGASGGGSSAGGDLVLKGGNSNTGEPDVAGDVKIYGGINNFASPIYGGALRFFTSDTERFTVLNDGKVGINNSNPGYELDVNGNVNVSGFLYGQGGGWYIDTSGNFSGNANYANSAGYVAASTNSNFNGFNASNIGTLSATSISLTNALPVASGGTGTSSFATGRILFGNGTSAINSTSTLFWDNANGRLGVGTSTPIAKLSITGTAGAQDILTIASSTNARLFSVSAGGILYNGNALINDSSVPIQLNGATAQLGVQRTAGTYGLLLGSYDSSTYAFRSVQSSDKLSFIVNNTVQALNILPSGNVGIGTTTPLTKLHIEGDFGTGGGQGLRLRNTNSGGYTELVFANNSDRSDGDFVFGYGGDTAGAVPNQAYFSNRNATPISFWTSNTQRLTIDGSGNVGIGTTTPGYALDIQRTGADSGASYNALNLKTTGTSGFGSALLLDTSSMTGGRKYTLYSSGPSDLGGAGGFGIYDNTGSAQRLFLNSSGNLGLGTTTPATNLVVAGNVAGNQVAIAISNAAASGYSVFRVGGGGASATGLGLHQFNSSYSGSGAYSASASTLSAFESGGLNLHAENASGAIRFFTAGNAAGNERVRIDNAGNVGIGSTTPSSKLTVAGTAVIGSDAANYLTFSGSASNPSLSVIGSSANADLLIQPKGAGQVVIGGGGWTYNTQSSGAGSIFFSNGTNDTPNMKFAYANNLNFGIDSASGGSFGTLSGQMLRFIKQSDETGGALIGGFDTSGNFSALGNFAAVGTGNSYVGGSFGVGTTTPNAKLFVTGTAGTQDIFAIASSTNARLLTVTSGGNVGIGTATFTGGALPSVGTNSFIVSGAGGTGMVVNDTTSFANFSAIGATEGNFSIGDSGATTGSRIWNFNSNDGILSLRRLTDAQSGIVSTPMTILANGNVGIGTSTPTETLSVAGNINLTGALKLNGSAGTSGMVLQTTGTGLTWVATSSLGISSDITALAVINGGRSNTVSGTNGVAFGLSNYNPAANGVAFGISNTIGTSSGYSTVIGTGNTAGSIGYNTVIGRTNTANSYQSTVVGIGNSAPTDYSTAIGINNLIYGAGASHIAFGDTNTINPGGASHAIAIGYNNTVNVGGASVFGSGITNNTSNSVMIGASDSAKLTILSSGNLGVGTSTPGQKLTVAGNAQFTGVGSGAYGFDLNLTADGVLTTSASDQRLKDNIMLINSSSTLEKINQLKPSTFTWKSDGSHDLGLIAQEVQTIFPELVFTNPSDGYLGINYSRFTPLLISAIQELSHKVDAMFAWFKDGKFNVQSDVCVDDVCVTKDQFKNMLRNAGAQQATVIQVVTPPATPPENNSTSTDEVVTPPTPVVEPTPEPTPEPTEPAPAN